MSVVVVTVVTFILWKLEFGTLCLDTQNVELVEHTRAPYAQMDYKRFTKQAQTCMQNKSPADSSLMPQLLAW